MKSSGTMKARLWAFAMIFLVMLGATGCFQEKKPFITLGNDALEVSSDAQSYKVAVESNMMWTAKSDQSWLTVLTQDGSFKSQVEFAVEANFTSEDRVAVIQVEGAGAAPVTIQVRQASAGLALYLLEEKVGFGKTGGSKKIAVMSNHEWQVLSSADWCTVSPKESGDLGDVNSKAGSVTKELTVTAEPNLEGVERTAEVSVICTAGVKEPVVRKLQVVQTAQEFYFVVPTKTWNLRADFQYVDVRMQIDGDNVEVMAEINADWLWFERERPEEPMSEPATKAVDGKRDGMIRLMPANPDGTFNLQAAPIFIPETRGIQMGAGETMVLEPGETHFLVAVADNYEGVDREGQITITARSNGGKPVVEVVTIKQSAEVNDLEVAMNEVILNGQGDEVEVAYSTSYLGSVEAHPSAEWISTKMCEYFEIGQRVVVISSEPNLTGQERVGFVTIEEVGKIGNTLGKSIKVVQQPLLTSFEFGQEKYTFPYIAGESYVTLKSYGKWSIDKTNFPDWLKVTPESGEGDATLVVGISDNMFTERRNVQVLFNNEDLHSTCILNIEQEGNPSGLKDFSHLGKGYDVSGRYAYDGDVRAAVLDWRKLYHSNRIADVINTNYTEEKNISGSSRKEYVEAYSVAAGISASYAGFTAGISTNFSESSLSSEANSFGTFRHMTKKQVIKLYDNVKAKEVLDCRSDMFVKDLERLNGHDLVTKYGTHVIMGLSLGGVLEFSMTANTKATGSTVDFGMAVEAGFETAGFGGSVSTGFQDYESLKKEECKLETNLTCRGGESQFASTGVPGGDGKNTYNQWLSSLTDAHDWVMVDYEGGRLIPIWEFIEDEAKSEEVRKYAQALLDGSDLPELQDNIKNLSVEIVRVDSNLHDGPDYRSEYNWNITTLLNGRAQRELWRAYGYSEGQYEGLNWESDSRRFYSYNRRRLDPAYRASPNTKQTLTLNFKDIKEIDNLTSQEQHFLDLTVVLEYNPGTNKWRDTTTDVPYPNNPNNFITYKTGMDGSPEDIAFTFRIIF